MAVSSDPLAESMAVSSDPLAESMEKKKRFRRLLRWFRSHFSCVSCPGKERRTPLSTEGHDGDNFSSNTDHIPTNGSRPFDAPSFASTSQSPNVVEHHDKVSNLIKALREDAFNVNLDALMDDIAGLLEAIKTQKESQKKTQRPKDSQKKTNRPTSAGFAKLKDLFLEGINGICSLKDALPAHEANVVARDIVKGLGQAHWVTSAFLLVSYFLDRYDTLTSNEKECLYLLEQMYGLAVDIKQLEEGQDLVKGGTELIVEASLMCCSQIDRSKFSMFFSTTIDNKELLDFKEKLLDFNLRMIRGMLTWICSRLVCQKVRPPQPREEEYLEYTVGIEESFDRVTKLLQWESEEKAVAVILHGFGGIGKTTLADAVFARYYVKDCKYSVVRLDSSSDIVKLQKYILRDLGTEDENLKFHDFTVGRGKIGDLLQEEKAFIYIDNVVKPESLKDLLLTQRLKDAKKLRLLITTRDIHVLHQLCNIKREVHEMQPLPHDKGKRLLSMKMGNGPDDINGQITDSELGKMVEISGGVPKLLDMIAAFIRSETQKKKAYRIVIQDSEKFTGNTFSGIDKSIFAYHDLPDECKNPFLDICFFLKGWKWETVANIVGESQLDVLEKRALVSKDKDMNVSLHDIILKIGKEKAQDGEVKARHTRIDFTEATAREIEEFFEKDMKCLQLIKGLWFSDQPCNIPVTKLNLMHDSLRIFGHKMVVENGRCEKIFDELLVYKGETPHFPFKWSCLKKLTFLSYRPQNLKLLQEIPSSNLKHIELDGSLCSVCEISFSDIQQLRALQVLRLINFNKLEKLPGEWGDHLKSELKELTLSHCTAMTQLTGSISQLTSLEILKLDNCCNLRRLPKDCKSWGFLRNLNVWNCPSLKWLPSSFDKALDSKSRRLFEHKGILSDSPQSESDSDYESDKDDDGI